MTLKLLSFWVFGGILIAVGSWILGHLEVNEGVSVLGYAFAFVIGLVLILLGGLAWINVSSFVSKHG
ncbi:MAG: hypothetical protein J7K72_01190 [Candidatus Aenigmarchaeota archaeon]|nr:hypothetical protein [Candidatus Aenigmarchaeota archaeon]